MDTNKHIPPVVWDYESLMLLLGSKYGHSFEESHWINSATKLKHVWYFVKIMSFSIVFRPIILEGKVYSSRAGKTAFFVAK